MIKQEETVQAGNFEAELCFSLEGCIIFLNKVEEKLEAGLWRFVSPPRCSPGFSFLRSFLGSHRNHCCVSNGGRK